MTRRNKDGKTPFEVAKDATQRSTMTLLNCVGGNDDKFLNCKSYPALSPEGIGSMNLEATSIFNITPIFVNERSI